MFVRTRRVRGISGETRVNPIVKNVCTISRYNIRRTYCRLTGRQLRIRYDANSVFSVKLTIRFFRTNEYVRENPETCLRVRPSLFDGASNGQLGLLNFDDCRRPVKNAITDSPVVLSRRYRSGDTHEPAPCSDYRTVAEDENELFTPARRVYG